MRRTKRCAGLMAILILLLAGAAAAQTGKPTVVPKAAKTQNSQPQAKAPARKKTAARKAELAQRKKEFEEMLITQEQQAWAEEKNQNADFFREAMTEQFVAAEPDGKRYTKAEVLRLIPTVKVISFELTDFQVIRAGRDAAVLTYRASVRSPVEDKETITNMLATTVWVRRGTAWKMAFHQKTLAP